MASPTTTHHDDAPKQHDTPGVGKQGDAPKVAAAALIEPRLAEDIDGVLLLRLYQDAINLTAARTMATAAGKAAQTAGAAAVASQNEPVVGAGA